jgi:sugar phosphate isomerase/epimerase
MIRLAQPQDGKCRSALAQGIGDEAANSLAGQINSIKDLGWQHLEMRGVEVPGFAKANFHDIPDAAFDQAVRQFDNAGIQVYCFGSTIMNWSKTVNDSFEPTVAEVKRAIPRMQRLGTKYVRIMSYKPGDEEYRIPSEVFRRVKDVTNMFLDAGLQPVHENCMNSGGMSWQHALELLDRCPGLKWVFDTATALSNGSVLTSTNIMAQINGDAFTWQPVNLAVDGEKVGDPAPHAALPPRLPTQKSGTGIHALCSHAGSALR